MHLEYDVQAKIKIYEESGHKELLEAYQKSQSVNEYITNEEKKIDCFLQGMKSVIQEAHFSLFEEDAVQQLDSDSQALLKEKSAEFEVIKTKLIELVGGFELFQDETRNIITQLPWQKEKEAQQKKYDDFVQRLEAQGVKNPDVYNHLVTKKRDIEQRLSQISLLEEQLQEQNEESDSLFMRIETHEKLLRSQREAIIRQWLGDNAIIKIHLNVMGDLLSAETSFRTLIRKPGREYARDILEWDDDESPKGGLILELINSRDCWEKRNEIIKRIIDADDRDPKGFVKPFVNHLAGLKIKTPEDIDRMVIWYPEDRISLKLVNLTGREEDIETGSAGQRTAAMLSLMLLLDDSPIIIDQPEEVLDTKRITDLVVSGLRNFKEKQQVIVISHNPNIPVNGAAENIIQMNFAGGQILKQISGALQKNEVREAICEVMEGGKDALDKRYFRISKALENTHSPTN